MKMDNEKLNELLVNVWDSLTDEQKAKAKACKTPDELLKLAGEEGIELPDEVLDAVAGGYILCSAQGWEVIHDSDGRVLRTFAPTDEGFAAAKDFAASANQSTEVIKYDKLTELRGGGKKESSSGC